MTEYRGYYYQENDKNLWDVMYPEDTSKPWVVDFETEAKAKAWIDKYIEDQEAQVSLEDRVTTLEEDSVQDQEDIDSMTDAILELAEDVAELQGGSV